MAVDVKDVPSGGSELARRRWLATVLEAKGVGDVVRYGATGDTPMTVEVLDRGDCLHVVEFVAESAMGNPAGLRHPLLIQGNVRAGHITSPKIAMDVHFILCTLATVVNPVNRLDQGREWIDGYLAEANRSDWEFDRPNLYATVRALRDWPYGKRDLEHWERAGRVDPKPRPPLFTDPDGGDWTSATHLGAYIRFGCDQPAVLSNGTISGLVSQLGGLRWAVNPWAETSRNRVQRIKMVLFRLPEPKLGGGETDV